MSNDDSHRIADDDRYLQEEAPGAPELGSVLLKETLRDALSNPGLILDEGTMLEEALRLMRERRQGCVLVTRDTRLSGIFTERDVLMKVVGTKIDLRNTSLRQCLTRDPVRLPADAVVAFALNKMVTEGFRHVPITDEDGRPVGVVSMRDIIEYLSGFFPKDVLNLPPEPSTGFRSREGA